MNKTILTISLALSYLAVISQADSTKNWSLGGDVGLNSSQVGFTNWSQGGENSISGVSFLHLFAKYKKNNLAWDNYLNLEYGLLQQGTGILKKSDDLLELGSKLGIKASEHWYYTVLSSFKTQFSKGYDYAKNDTVYISDFMSPAYILGGLGMDYKPNGDLSLYLSLVTIKYTIVNDTTLAKSGAFGVQKYEIEANGNIINYKTTRLEMGAYLKLVYKKDIAKNVNLLTSVDLYSNYLKNPQNIDIDWKVEILMKVNKFINASIKTQLVYDDDVNIVGKNDANGLPTYGPKTQFKEAIAVGLIYKFNN